MGTQTSIEDCAKAVWNNQGKFFIYGKGSKAGACYQENTEHMHCYTANGNDDWETDLYDFFQVGDAIDYSDSVCALRGEMDRLQLAQNAAILIFAAAGAQSNRLH